MRVSTTQLEAFRLYMREDWMSEAELLLSITGDKGETAAMRLGRAFGSVLERPSSFKVDGGYLCEGYSFSDEQMRAPLLLTDKKFGLFEVKVPKEYRTEQGWCEVVAKLDHLVGGHIYEFKTSETVNIAKYLDSYQWRYYLDVFGSHVLTYYIWPVNDRGNGVVDIGEVHTLHAYSYPGMHEDCQALLQEFCNFMQLKGWDKILKNRKATGEEW